MGTSRKIRYVVKYFGEGCVYTPCEWKTKVQGKPTAENLVKDVAHFEASTLPTGVNSHLGYRIVDEAFIYDQLREEVLARFIRCTG